MQTIERPSTAPQKGPRLPTVLWAVLGVAVLGVVVLAVLSQIGALLLLGLAVLAAGAIWVWRKGFLFIEAMAFLIHFDGLGWGPVRLGRILAAVALVVIAIKLLKGWKPLALPPRTWIPVWLFTSWAVISGFWSDEVGSWFFTIGVYGLGVAYFFVAGLLVEDHQLVQKFLRAYWMGGLFGSAAGILALFLGTRSVGFGGDPNFFGLLQASMIPLTVYYRRNAPTIASKWWYTAILCFVLAGAAGAGSRSGLIGGAAAIVATMVTRPGLTPARRGGVAIGSLFVAGFAFLVGFIANPNNLERGFGDRGAGRIDLWGATVGLITDNPVVGYGFGQIRTMLAQEMLVTPGSQLLGESRTDVSTHNTWLDVQADLGTIGLAIFVTIIVVALAGLVWPRWTETRELSTTLLVMMVPVITGSFFLPLLNNKLAWVLVGLSASLQVPSWRSRWPGWARSAAERQRRPSTELAVAGSLPPHDGAAPMVPAYTAGAPTLAADRLARWDLSLRWPFLPLVIAAAVLAAVVGGAASSMVPTTYTGSATFVVPRVDGSPDTGRVAFERTRLQTVLTTGVSLPFAAEIAELAELDETPHVVAERLGATRPRMGLIVQVDYTSTDRDEVQRVQRVLHEAMDNVYSDAYGSAAEEAENELRPIVPGESRIYDGPAFIHSYDADHIVENPPRTAWFAFCGFLSGAILAAGVGLVRSRSARVAAEDDLEDAIALRPWARLQWRRPWTRVPEDEVGQILASAVDVAPPDASLRRFLVAADRPDLAQYRTALAVSAALLRQGRRVVLVDAGTKHGALSWRLGLGRQQGVHELALGEVSLGEVIERPTRRHVPRVLRGASSDADQLRVVPAGGRGLRRSASSRPPVPTEVFDELAEDISIVLVAPASEHGMPAVTAIGWADVILLGASPGRTRTRDLDGVAAQVHLFGEGPAGVVLIDG